MSGTNGITHFCKISRLTIILIISLLVLLTPFRKNLFILHAQEKWPHGTIRVGIFPFEPFNFIDQSGRAEGLNPDLLRKITEDEPWDVQFIPVTWAEGLEKLKKGEIDLMPSVAYSPERAEVMDYTYESVLELWGQVFVKPGGKSKNINDLSGKKVGIMKRDISGANFIKTAENFGVTCEIREYASHGDVFGAVQNGEVEAGVAPQHFGLRHAGEYNLVGSTILFSPFSIYFAAKKGAHHELLSHIDAHMSEWKRDRKSFYYQRLNYWIGNGNGTLAKLQPWLIYAFFFLFASAALFGIFTFLLGRAVKKRTKELQLSEKRFRDIATSISDWIWEVDTNGIFRYCSENSIKMYGYTSDELIGKNALDFLMAPEDHEKAESLFSGLMKNPAHYRNFEHFNIRKDGSKILVSTSGVPVISGSGQLSGYRGIDSDITGIKEAEMKIRESNHLLNMVLETTTDAIFVKDNEGRYLMANTATCRAMGKDAGQVIGRKDMELFPPESAKVIYETDSKILSEATTILLEEKLETACGTTFWLTNKTPYRNETGEVIGLIGISRNISNIKRADEERKRLEIKLQQAQKMEAIGTLAGGIAHDFNNILTAILGYSELIKDDMPQGSAAASDIIHVINAGNRAKDLVRQILAFSRQVESERSSIMPATIIKEAVKLLRPSLPTTIEIAQDIDSGAGPILADPTQMHQIIVNLCTNSYHAMEEKGGKLSISLKSLYLSSEDLLREPGIQPGFFIKLSVSDSGEGISPDIQHRIFDPYFTTKHMDRGTGMGLSIVHGIVKSYSGFITCYSTLGEGTIFNIFLPIIHSESDVETESETALPGGSEAILFIDDEELLANMGKTMLERLGYSVTVRNSSLEALTAFQNEPEKYDLVITDQTMPGMTGIDMARRMLQIRPDTPIILCTGYSNLVSEERVKAAGIREFALKPVTRKDIAGLIRKVLKKN